MTKIILLLLLQSLFRFAYPLPYSSITLIESICRKTPFYDLCVSTLEADPRRGTTEVPVLARIVADSVNAQAIATLNHIGSLLKNPMERYSIKALKDCFDLYNNILQVDIPAAINAIEEGNLKFADKSAGKAGDRARKCEVGFRGNSPVPFGNKRVHDLSLVLQFIASLLKH